MRLLYCYSHMGKCYITVSFWAAEGVTEADRFGKYVYSAGLRAG
jgi:hypothetical protein